VVPVKIEAPVKTETQLAAKAKHRKRRPPTSKEGVSGGQQRKRQEVDASAQPLEEKERSTFYFPRGT